MGWTQWLPRGKTNDQWQFYRHFSFNGNTTCTFLNQTTHFLSGLVSYQTWQFPRSWSLQTLPGSEITLSNFCKSNKNSSAFLLHKDSHRHVRWLDISAAEHPTPGMKTWTFQLMMMTLLHCENQPPPIWDVDEDFVVQTSFLSRNPWRRQAGFNSWFQSFV